MYAGADVLKVKLATVAAYVLREKDFSIAAAGCSDCVVYSVYLTVRRTCSVHATYKNTKIKNLCATHANVQLIATTC
eukprot:COSAG02_NODE_732_length_17973_cov_6.920275_10_plen_77_part_00